MDNNISRRRSSVDASTASVYLSFDAESTMSKTCYKTLEAMNDISAISNLSKIEDASSNTEDKHVNSTLENDQDSLVLSPLKTVKKMEILTTSSPLRVLPKNILREYKSMYSSTPSKEQLLKSVDVTRGSRCDELLGVAFLGVDDELPAFFPPPPPQLQRQQLRYEDNKENAMPESGDDGSTLSVSSSVEIVTSVIEKKRVNSVSTAGSLTGEDSIEEIKCIEIAKEVMIVEQNLEKTGQVNDVNNAPFGADTVENISDQCPTDGVDTTPKAKFDNPEKIETITEDVEMPEELIPKVDALNEIKKPQSYTKLGDKQKIAMLTSRNVRRSVCEPNLQTNKPSRISAIGPKRQSLLPITRKMAPSIDVETEIPLLMSKLLKISNTSRMESEVENKPNKDDSVQVKKPLQTTDKRRSAMGPTKGRSSLMPPSLGEKRPFGFTQRMSVIVKTTLNSPARKIARKSTMASSGHLVQQQQRRSMMTNRFSQTTRITKVDTDVVRKSMIPSSKPDPLCKPKTKTDTLTTLKETTTQQRTFMYPLTKLKEETKLKPPPPTSSVNKIQSKIEETIFTCNSCKEKFRVKSLLDAHRRSHEGDIANPAALVKNPTSTAPSVSSASSLLGNPNKCKYCDKKFALVRALRIHLLQNCSKIPPAEKKKLEYTEMNHVEKARLPNVFNYGNGIHSTASSTQATPRGVAKQNVVTKKTTYIPKSSAETSMEKDLKNKPSCESTSSSANGSHSNIQANATTAVVGSIQKTKKSSAHSGVYRTPSKTVPCHVCKLTFKSILDYTNHSLATHGYKAQKDDQME